MPYTLCTIIKIWYLIIKISLFIFLGNKDCFEWNSNYILIKAISLCFFNRQIKKPKKYFHSNQNHSILHSLTLIAARFDDLLSFWWFIYIIGHYNPSVRIINLVSHTTYVVCVIFLYISGGTYSLKSIPNDRFFEKLFMAILFTHRVFARNLLRGNRRKNTFSYFCFDDWPGARTLAFRLISQHTTY